MPSPILQEGPLPLGFTEFKDSGQEDYNFRDGKVEFIRIFDGPWEHRTEFIFEHILPSVTEAEGEVFYNAPNNYPAYPAARPYRATVKGLLKTDKDSDNFIKHTLARITVFYGLPEIVDSGGGGNNNGEDPDDPERIYVEESVETETEIIPLPAHKFEYVYNSNGLTTDYESMLAHPDAVTKKATPTGKINHLIKRINYKLRLPYVIFPRWTYITYLAGKLNSVFFLTPSGLLAAPGQLRYDGISAVTKREISLGALAWEMEHSFSFYRPGWNTHPTIEEIGSNNFIVTNAAIKPRLYHEGILQRIFINVPNNIATQWRDIWIELLLSENANVTKFYTDNIDPLTQEVIDTLKEIMPTLNIWR